MVKQGSNPYFKELLRQSSAFDIPLIESQEIPIEGYDLIVDALFGFSFKPPVRDNFRGILESLYTTATPIASIDIPSGWDVNTGPPNNAPHIKPDLLISLTVPKKGSASFRGAHYIGGRFVPKGVADKFKLTLPDYPEGEQIVEYKG